jgi:hypothetical protein
MRARDEQTRGESTTERRTAAAGAEPVLALQRTAGNRAVNALLARQPVETTTEAATTEADRQMRAVLAGVGTIALLSYSVGGDDRYRTHDVHFMSEQGDHSAKLAQAAIDGSAMDVDVRAGRRPTESWTLNYESIEENFDKRGS